MYDFLEDIKKLDLAIRKIQQEKAKLKKAYAKNQQEELKSVLEKNGLNFNKKEEIIVFLLLLKNENYLLKSINKENLQNDLNEILFKAWQKYFTRHFPMNIIDNEFSLNFFREADFGRNEVFRLVNQLNFAEDEMLGYARSLILIKRIETKLKECNSQVAYHLVKDWREKNESSFILCENMINTQEVQRMRADINIDREEIWRDEWG